MAKSIKLKNNNYIDSTGVVHNRGLLSTLLNNITTNISNLLTNVNKTIPVTLFNNDNNRATSVTLSDTLANYTKIIIYCKQTDGGYYYSREFYNPNGKILSFQIVECNATSIYNRELRYYGNAKSISTNANNCWRVDTHEHLGTYNNVYIVKVIGYKN